LGTASGKPRSQGGPPFLGAFFAAAKNRAIRSNSSQKGRAPFLLRYFREPKIRRILVNYPLRCRETASMPFLDFEFLLCKNSRNFSKPPSGPLDLYCKEGVVQRRLWRLAYPWRPTASMRIFIFGLCTIRLKTGLEIVSQRRSTTHIKKIKQNPALRAPLRYTFFFFVFFLIR
jgi:hypothetical protein